MKIIYQVILIGLKLSPSVLSSDPYPKRPKYHNPVQKYWNTLTKYPIKYTCGPTPFKYQKNIPNTNRQFIYFCQERDQKDRRAATNYHTCKTQKQKTKIQKELKTDLPT